MKKHIDGKLYNTETAKKIADWNNGKTGELFFSETLHQKKTGEFFLFGTGEPQSKYSEFHKNSWLRKGSSVIIPMSWENAKEWAEKHMISEDYNKFFGEISDNPTKRIVTLNLMESTVNQSKRIATKKGISYSTYIEDLILADIKNNQKTKERE